MSSTIGAWDSWNEHRGPQYPHEKVIQFVFRNFPSRVRAGKLALDLGCGNGVNSVFMAEQGFDVVACDFSPTAVSKAQEAFSQRNLKGTHLVQELSSLELGSTRFDFVISIGVFDSAGYEASELAMSTLAKKMKPDSFGLFVFASDLDFRVLQGETLIRHGYTRVEVEELFSSFDNVDIDQYSTTYASGLMLQHEWIVTFRP